MTAHEAPLRVGVTGGREYADPPRGALAGRVEAALRACLAVAGDAGLVVAHGANPAAWGGDALCGRACAELRREGLPAQVRGFAVEPGLDGAWPAAGRALDASPARPHTLRMPESNPADPTTPPPATDAPGEPAAEELDFDSLGGARDPWTPRSRYSTAPRRNYELLRRDMSADERDAHETNKRARRPRRAA